MAATLIAVDWGTSNRRIFHMDAEGAVVAQRSDALGVLAVTDFPAEIAALRREAGDCPLLLAGMVGSNRGWIEVPYVEAPAGLADIAAGIVRPLPGVAIVPGVVQRNPAAPDIMRGEEVQLIGAQIGDGLACHPGTHTKWISVAGGRITRFATVMTGDIMAALAAKSILSDVLAMPADDDAAFIAGVDAMLAGGDLGNDLFGVRARVVTGLMPATAASSRISGLLIGADVRFGLTVSDVPVTLIGDPGLCRRFTIALQRAGRHSVVIDGTTAFVAGAHALSIFGDQQ